MSDDLTAGAGLLWAEAQRQMDEQKTSLESLRTRAVALLSVGSLVAALFGSRLTNLHHLHEVAFAGALAAFGLSVLAVIRVIMPRRGWELSQKLSPYTSDLRDGKPVTPLDVTVNLTDSSVTSWGRNETKLACIYRWFWIACALIGLQVVLMGLAIL